MDNPSPWRRIADDPPPCDTSFVLAIDGYWLKAQRGNKPIIIVDWHGGQRVAIALKETGFRYWMPVDLRLLPNIGG